MSVWMSIKSKWKRGISSELRFWDGYFSGRYPQYEAERTFRLDPEQPLQSELTGYLRRVVKEEELDRVRVLDVGAGPLTFMGKTLDGKAIDITAVDPLAEDYDLILERYGIVPPVRTKKRCAEELTSLFSENTFDMVVSRNALDHSYDAVKAVSECVAVAKRGHPVVLQNAVNEARRQNYKGLHQWNFDVRDGEFVVSNKWEDFNVSKILQGVATVRVELYCSEWVNLVIRKS